MHQHSYEESQKEKEKKRKKHTRLYLHPRNLIGLNYLSLFLKIISITIRTHIPSNKLEHNYLV